MDCIYCNNSIPLARLKAIPSAKECVECLEANGDVDKILKFTEPIGTNGEEFIESYTDNPNQYLRDSQNKLKGIGFVYIEDDEPLLVGVHRAKIVTGEWPAEEKEEETKKDATNIRKHSSKTSHVR